MVEKNPSLSVFCNQQAFVINTVYHRAFIPSASVHRFVKQLQIQLNKYQNIIRSYISRCES